MKGYLGYMQEEEEPLNAGYLGVDKSSMSQEAMAPEVAESAGSGATAATGAKVAAASGGNPYVAGAMIGGQFLTQYLAARAAEERQKQQLAMRNQEQYAQNQTGALNNLMSAYRSALR